MLCSFCVEVLILGVWAFVSVEVGGGAIAIFDVGINTYARLVSSRQGDNEHDSFSPCFWGALSLMRLR